MTTLQKFNLLLPLLSLALVPCGCLEIEISTQVHRDGSLIRTESVTGDSAEVLAHGFVSPVDSTWNVTFGSNDGRLFDRRASRQYRSPDEMNAAMMDTAWKTIPVRVQIESRFIWFYTEMTYRERYLKWNPFDLIPLAEYVSTDDLARAMRFESSGKPPSKEDSLARERVGQKWTEWMFRDMFEGYFKELMKGVNLLNDPSLPASAIASHKEEIFSRCEKWWAYTASMDTIGAVIESIVKNPGVKGALEANAAGFARHREKLTLVSRVTGKLKQINVEMPGLYVDSNAPTVDKNRGSWKGVSNMSYAADYELWMTSRVVNWWVVVLTLLVIVGGIGFIYGSPLGRRRVGQPGLEE